MSFNILTVMIYARNQECRQLGEGLSPPIFKLKKLYTCIEKKKSLFKLSKNGYSADTYKRITNAR